MIQIAPAAAARLFNLRGQNFIQSLAAVKGGSAPQDAQALLDQAIGADAVKQEIPVDAEIVHYTLYESLDDNLKRVKHLVATVMRNRGNDRLSIAFKLENGSPVRIPYNEAAFKGDDVHALAWDSISPRDVLLDKILASDVVKKEIPADAIAVHSSLYGSKTNPGNYRVALHIKRRNGEPFSILFKVEDNSKVTKLPAKSDIRDEAKYFGDDFGSIANQSMYPDKEFNSILRQAADGKTGPAGGGWIGSCAETSFLLRAKKKASGGYDYLLEKSTSCTHADSNDEYKVEVQDGYVKNVTYLDTLANTDGYVTVAERRP